MGLAAVQIPMSDFDRVHQHMVTHRPTSICYSNMHLRETRQRNKKRVLRFLHAMRARPGDTQHIDGMISGPDILVKYEIVPGRRLARVIVSIDDIEHAEDARLADRFLRDVLDKVAEEQGGPHPPPGTSPGMLYLKRALPGAMTITHTNCQDAIRAKTLDPRFLNEILSWGFRLTVGH